MSVAEQRVFKLVEKESFEPVASGELGHEGEDGVLAGVGVVDGRYAAVYATDPG
ncbi:MAG: hypothetical protein RMK31_04890 [Candidatus Caldarchaeum sp.]|nr:hypothetical protein [Candidatus Caldarchaeum sp.]